MLPHGSKTWCSLKEARHKGPVLYDSTLYEVPQVVKLTETESRRVTTRGWVGKEEQGSRIEWGRRIWEDEKVMEVDGGDFCKTMGTFLMLN